MGKSGRVKLRDVNRAHRLIHEARDVGHDPAAWPVVVAEGLGRLIGARYVAMTCITCDGPGQTARGASLADLGWDSTAQRELYLRYPEILRDFGESSLHEWFVTTPGQLLTRDRSQIIDDNAWHRSVEYDRFSRVIGFDALLLSYNRLDGGRAHLGFGLARHAGESPFDARARRLLRLFHAELLRHLDRGLLRAGVSPLDNLAPRLRRTLDRLLAGDSSGQAALNLGLSRHTVNEYIAALYRKMGVRSRGELMAVCRRLERAPARLSA